MKRSQDYICKFLWLKGSSWESRNRVCKTILLEVLVSEFYKRLKETLKENLDTE